MIETYGVLAAIARSAAYARFMRSRAYYRHIASVWWKRYDWLIAVVVFLVIVVIGLLDYRLSAS